MDNPTKYYSERQERRIADYLGWSAVSASGARPFNPGDIKDSDWLGECKTYTKLHDTIVFKKGVWIKICDEAKSSFKHPVVFTDNGTQKLEYTWCLVDSKFVDYSKGEEVDAEIKETALKFTFKHGLMYDLFKSKTLPYAKIEFNNQTLLILRISDLKEMLQDV